MQTRPRQRGANAHKLVINWGDFEKDDTQHFDTIPVTYSAITAFEVPPELKAFVSKLTHGTVIEVQNLHHVWGRDALKALKAALAKLINPFGSSADKFSITISAPDEKEADRAAEA